MRIPSREVQLVQIIGKLWMPMCDAATEKTLSAYDMENLGDPRDRDNVERWIMLNSGDFSSVTDFRADFTIGGEDIVHEWANEDSEIVYNDCMYADLYGETD
jgi:hypothetical protein